MPVHWQSTSDRSASGLRCAARRIVLLFLSGLSIATVTPARTMAQDAPVVQSPLRDSYVDHITAASGRFTIPSAWIAAVMREESAGDAR